MEYQIGDFAKISRLGIKTLRYYHEIGLLPPSRIDRFSGYRYYDETCLTRARAIIQLKQFDFSLEDIRSLLAEAKDSDDLIQAMQQKSTEIKNRIESYQIIQKQIEAFIRNEKDITNHSGDVTVKELSDIHIASIRFQGKYSDLTDKITTLYEHSRNQAAGRSFCLYYDEQSMEDHADIEVCIPVLNPVEDSVVHSRLLPGGKAVTVLHTGEYEQLWRTYKVIIDYINSNNLKVISPSRECYLKADGELIPVSPSQYLTEIQFLFHGSHLS
ncbi:MAG TPA: GyrI-like domain-containing protein [Longilinea sp.]|nr:GyrI-like domain-containing protein [Longilinea sp.]